MLSQFLITQLFAFLLVFSRVGSALMIMPGFGEAYVSPRVRLMLALMFSLVLSPALHGLPQPPATVAALFYILLSEITVGLFLGGLARMLIGTIHIAGTIIAFQSSLASALTANISGFSGQDTSVGNLLSMSALVLLFATDLHHLMLKSLADSYSLFAAGHFPLTEGMAEHAARTMSDSFTMAMQLAAPNIVIGTMIYLGAGILARLMPNLQIFFLLMAPQLLISFFIIMITFSAFMMWYLDYFRDTLTGFLAPG